MPLTVDALRMRVEEKIGNRSKYELHANGYFVDPNFALLSVYEMANEFQQYTVEVNSQTSIFR